MILIGSNLYIVAATIALINWLVGCSVTLSGVLTIIHRARIHVGCAALVAVVLSGLNALTIYSVAESTTPARSRQRACLSSRAVMRYCDRLHLSPSQPLSASQNNENSDDEEVMTFSTLCCPHMWSRNKINSR